MGQHFCHWPETISNSLQSMVCLMVVFCCDFHWFHVCMSKSEQFFVLIHEKAACLVECISTTHENKRLNGAGTK